MAALLALALAVAFSPPARLSARPAAEPRVSVLRLQDYDLSRQDFDLLELRSFRRETILRYDQLNRSEQLRILFWFSNTFIALFYPYISQELFMTEADTLTVVGSGVAALTFGAIALREKSVRGSKLRRYEKEGSLSELSVCQPGNALGGRAQPTLASLRGKKRVVLVYGAPSVLLDALQSCAVYRRRFLQSSVVLVDPHEGKAECSDFLEHFSFNEP